MTITKEDLSEIVAKYLPVQDYLTDENFNSITFHLNNKYEIAISLKESEKEFYNYEGLGQYRQKGQKGFGLASCIMGGNTEREVIENILKQLLEFNLKNDSPQRKDLVKQYEELAKRLEVYINDPIRNNPKYLWDGFGLIHNRIISLSEMLSHYYAMWDEFLKNNPDTSKKIIIKEIFGRITTITTWCFVSVFSAIEFTIKNIILDSKEEEFSKFRNKLQKGDRVYLEDIIKKSVYLNIVTKEELPKWIALIELRNIFVHNNGFPDSNELYEPVKKYFTVFKKNEMTMGSYDNFFTFTEMLVSLYQSWSKNYRKN